jgi:carbon-monoxide dehydrogenase small subunit
MGPMAVEISLNGRRVQAWVRTNKTLLEALRDDFGATDVKYGCGEGVCGTCTVLLDGEPVNACLTFAVQANGRHITTLAGLVGDDGGLHPLQQAFLQNGASQCGFCTPGMIVTAYHWLKKRQTPPDREEIREALSGNLCRCTGYSKILDAVEAYAQASLTDREQRLEDAR